MKPTPAIPAKLLSDFVKWDTTNPEAAAGNIERKQRLQFYSSWTADRLKTATRDDIVAFFSPLWSMAMWGNKAGYVDQVIADNGQEVLRTRLLDLLHGQAPLAQRWDDFRSHIKRVGPAMASELLAHVHPTECLPWTSVSRKVFEMLKVPETPKQSYQLDGKAYLRLCAVAKEIGKQLAASGAKDCSVMGVNYFVWWFGQIAEQKSASVPPIKDVVTKEVDGKVAEFLHNEVRDKIADIGRWLGFTSRTEVNVAPGSRIDTIWEATIGNLGRVIYVFEVQTKGSIDGLIVNLLKAMNNPAVQGVVAVSDTGQLLKIKSHATGVPNLSDKLKTWDYVEVLRVHESLEGVNQRINALGLVPAGF